MANSEVYRRAGHCAVCEQSVEFAAKYDWYRDHLRCSVCNSIPRERALALVLSRTFPNWRSLAIHESSPGPASISRKLKEQCPDYVASQFYPNRPLGKIIDGFRNENLELQTFESECFDLVISQDVMEHVNQPADVMCEVARTLKPGGVYLFTAPTYKDRVTSERRALFRDDGTVEHSADPEYHGNPINEAGSLVTFHYGYDLPELIHKWSGLNVEVYRFHDHEQGIIGEFTEVYLVKKSGSTNHGVQQRAVFDGVTDDVRMMCEGPARKHAVSAAVHKDDFIFRFIYDNPVFPTKQSAIDYYFSDGARSATKVRALIDKHLDTRAEPFTVLEFAAGYGAVTRHALQALSPHVLHSSDIHEQANDFLSRILGGHAVQSVDVPEDLKLPTSYDAIFVLSFFSHMPRSTWGRWLAALYRGLKPGGILMFTTHGETSMRYFATAQLDATGYWFDSTSEQGDLETAKYGQTITSKVFVDAHISELGDAEYIAYEPAAWWEHQDLYVLRKPLSSDA